MLIAPFLLKGAVALKTLFLLNTSPTSWYPRKANRGLFGPTAMYVLGSAISEYFSLDTVESPRLDISLDGVQFLMDPAPQILLLDAAPEVLLLDAAPVIILEVPTLDWSVPETPTLFVPKAPEVPSDVITYDFYFNIIDFAPPDSVFWVERRKDKPFVPVIPDVEAPPVWQYEFPELTFERLCLKKGSPPRSLGQGRIDVVFGLRGFALLWILWDICSWFVDYPRCLLEAWKFYRERRRPRPTPLVINDYDFGDWD
ncbi:hypothetical protein FOMPIDRAFT_1013945 [Fomitopsis schrenkii]|uniref:Uncharacterized protein n=1 Tax=Fomitopsis schrenkii TaxID=2126942 RepID=S8EK16_FOMSC|nr:hypothetical protein FOMPIDRAFT_1013945 [Fomitopsis schrenkii]